MGFEPPFKKPASSSCLRVKIVYLLPSLYLKTSWISLFLSLAQRRRRIPLSLLWRQNHGFSPSGSDGLSVQRVKLNPHISRFATAHSRSHVQPNLPRLPSRGICIRFRIDWTASGERLPPK